MLLSPTNAECLEILQVALIRADMAKLLRLR